MIVNFRNDDVRHVLDSSLIKISELFIEKKIPLTYAVEPANLTTEVIDWLKEKKETYPDLIEIVQHGYNHNYNFYIEKNGKIKKGEFGSKMTYEEQFNLISKGQLLMNKYFDKLWFNAFVFPCGAFNKESIKVLDNLNFEVVTGVHHHDLKHKFFYTLGRILNKKELLGHTVSYNLKNKLKSNVFEIGTGISIIKKYISDTEADFLSLSAIQKKILCFKNNQSKNVGILLHHRFHKKEEDFLLLEDLLNFILLQKDIQNLTLEETYKRFKK